MQHLEEILKRMKNLTAEEFDQVFECDNEFHERTGKNVWYATGSESVERAVLR